MRLIQWHNEVHPSKKKSTSAVSRTNIIATSNTEQHRRTDIPPTKHKQTTPLSSLNLLPAAVEATCPAGHQRIALSLRYAQPSVASRDRIHD